MIPEVVVALIIPIAVAVSESPQAAARNVCTWISTRLPSHNGVHGAHEFGVRAFRPCQLIDATYEKGKADRRVPQRSFDTGTQPATPMRRECGRALASFRSRIPHPGRHCRRGLSVSLQLRTQLHQ